MEGMMGEILPEDIDIQGLPGVDYYKDSVIVKSDDDE